MGCAAPSRTLLCTTMREGGGGACGNLALLRVPCAAAISRAIGQVGSFKIYFNRSIIGLKGL